MKGTKKVLMQTVTEGSFRAETDRSKTQKAEACEE